MDCHARIDYRADAARRRQLSSGPLGLQTYIAIKKESCMQKLDYTKTLQLIADQLKSEEIMAAIEKGIQSLQGGFDGNNFTATLLSSKSNYDKLTNNPIAMEILNSLGAQLVYDNANYSQLLNRTVTANQLAKLIYEELFYRFYSLHNSIKGCLKNATTLLVKDDKVQHYEKQESNILILQVDSGNLTLTLSNIITIFELLRDLADEIQRHANADRQKEDLQVVLLDSGSEFAVGVKATTELLQTLLDIFKQIWNWRLTRRYEKNLLENQIIANNLELLKIIRTHNLAGELSEVEAKALTTLVTRKTNDLFDLNVLPKQIAMDVRTESNMKLLQEQTSRKQLTAGEQGNSDNSVQA